ncbi:MAG TPA: MFS transporter [Streptosporangiaceae bacterium]|jgi:MFS family permease|nr:MFS transporter [Streptosporangiaceae bacterium]
MRLCSFLKPWLPLAAICAGTFMLLVDVTIVTVALPDMARSLHTSFSELQWVIDIYALVLAALVLTAGAVADRIGRRAVYLSGLVLFAASSAASGAAINVPMLIAARGVQGCWPERSSRSRCSPRPSRSGRIRCWTCPCCATVRSAPCWSPAR